MLDCRAASGNTRDQVNYSNFINGRCCVFTLLSSYLNVLGVIFSPNGKMIHPYKLGKKCKYGCWYRLLIIVQSNFDNPNIRLIWTKFFFPVAIHTFYTENLSENLNSDYSNFFWQFKRVIDSGGFISSH